MSNLVIYNRWAVVAGCAVALIWGLSSYTAIVFGQFITPLQQEFNWSRTNITAAHTLATIAILICSPLIGRIVDKYGARNVLLPSVVCFSFAVMTMSQLNGNLYQFYLFSIVIAIFGAGTLPITFTRIVMNWFDDKLGLALGLALAGIGVANALLPPFIQNLIASYDWQTAYLILGGTILTISVPIVYILMPEQPRQSLISTQAEKNAEREIYGFEIADVFKQYSFWIILVSFMILGFTGTAVIIHIMPFLMDTGLDAATAAKLLASIGVSVILSRILVGYLVDRFFAPRVALIFLSGIAIGMLILATQTNIAFIIFGLVLLGLGLGAEFDFISFLITRYIGSKSYGQAYGAVYSAFVLGSALGPLFLGMAYDHYQSYSYGLIIAAAISSISVILLQFLGPYPNLKIMTENNQ